MKYQKTNPRLLLALITVTFLLPSAGFAAITVPSGFLNSALRLQAPNVTSDHRLSVTLSDPLGTMFLGDIYGISGSDIESISFLLRDPTETSLSLSLPDASLTLADFTSINNSLQISDIALNSASFDITSFSGTTVSTDLIRYQFTGTLESDSGLGLPPLAEVNGSFTYTTPQAGTPGAQSDIRFNLSSFEIAAIPEPSSALLLGLGVLGFIVFRRRIK